MREAARAPDKGFRRRPTKYRSAVAGPPRSEDRWGDRVDITTVAVACIVGFGLLVFFTWLTLSLTNYQTFKVGVVPPKEFVVRDLDAYATAPKVGWDWWAFFLGPIWFFAEGIWTHAIVLLLIAVLSGGVLLPFVMVYSAAKGREVLEDRRIAKDSVY